ncbi:MAG: alpha/beta fold hydrolase [Gemmatimonadota bacterium]
MSVALHRLGSRTAIPVLLVPGTFSNHTFWLGTRGIGFARALVEDGFEACALDPRGHGESQKPKAGERWDFDHWAREDVPTALRTIIAEGRRPFVVGHSAGGAAALAALAAEPSLRAHVRGVVLVATPVPWLQPWRGAGAWLIRAISRILGRFPARRLRLGPEDELEGVMAQWMDWQLTGHWLGDDGTDYGAALGSLDLPLFAITGSGDRFFAPPYACRGLYDLIGSPDKTFLQAGRGSGFAENFNHVSILVGRAARTEIWPKIVAWLHAVS